MSNAVNEVPRTTAEREALILHVVEQRRLVGLAELQSATGVSLPTLRRDLTRLADRGALERTRGGARAVSGPSTLDEAFESRRLRQSREKTLIGHLASALVPADSMVFMNDGSTVLALAHEIAQARTKLRIATSAVNIAEFLAAYNHVEVLCLGGFLRASSFGTVGPLATKGIEALVASIAFVGCDAIHPKMGVMWKSVDDAHVARTMAAQSSKVVVLADSSKFDRQAPALGLRWEDVDIVVTDTATPALRGQLAHQRVQVLAPNEPRSVVASR